MGKTRRTGDLVTDNNLYVNPTDDSFHVGTGITMYGGSVGIISCTGLYIGGSSVSAGGGSIGIQSGGTSITSEASTINFVGTGITMADDGSVTDITIPTMSRTATRVVATDAQTAFTVAAYDSSLIDVYLNGVKLDSTEYSTTNSTTITLTTGASTGDIFESVSYSNFTGVNVTSANSATTATTATTATNVTVADESSDTTCFPLFATAATGDLPPRTDASALTYDASNGTLSATTFSGTSGNITGAFTCGISGGVGIGTTNPQQKLHILANGNPVILLEDGSGTDQTFTRYKSSAGDWTTGVDHQDDAFIINQSSDLRTGTAAFYVSSANNIGISSESPSSKLDVAGTITATTFKGNLDLAGLLKEGVNITAGKLSANTNIDLANGMVHLFTTTETATSTPNIRVDSSTSLDSSMNTGESVTVVLISAAAAAGYSAQLTIDGSAVTESWLGGSAPSTGGSSGYDVYTYNIIKTGSATFVVLANLVNFA